MSGAQSYHDGLITQGYSPADAVSFTQQHYPDFAPAAAAPAQMAAPAVAAAPAAAAVPMAAAPVAVQMVPAGSKSHVVAILLSFFLGALGVDRFYLGYTGLGILKLVTFGGLGLWALIDFIRIIIKSLGPADGSAYA